LRSVLGPAVLPAGAIVDAHEHTWIDAPAAARAAGLPALTREDAVAEELRAFAAAGGAAVIDCQPPFCGRDLERMRAISRASGVAIVASTGFHLPAWYDAGSAPWAWSSDEAEAFFSGEVEDGPAGAIKAAHDGGRRDPEVRRLLEAAAAAAARTGAPLVVHTERGEAVDELAGLLTGAGAAPGQVLLCHVDKRPDVGLHRELAAAGFRLEYDTFVRPRYAPEQGVWPLVVAMVEAGRAGSVAVGLDLADPALWGFAGGPGMRALSHDIPARLRERGVDEADVEALCGGTARGLLSPVREVVGR
jgi:5-phospho-D-xylono-1,4-lactonase